MKTFFSFLKSRVFLIQIALALVLLVIIVLLSLSGLKSYTHHGEFVEVPDFSRLSTLEMKKLAQKSNLNFQVVDSSNYNPDFPRFSILEQNPRAGTRVKEGRTIYFTINPSGYREVTVPDIIQESLRNAESRLRAVGLEVDRITYIDELGKDMVYYVKYKGKEVNAGTRLPKTSKLELVCGNGSGSNSEGLIFARDPLANDSTDVDFAP